MKYSAVLILALMMGLGAKIQVVQSTSQDWVGGLQESGYGTDFKLILKVKAPSNQLQFDDLWVGDKHLKVRVYAGTGGQQSTVFAKGDKIIVKAGLTFRPGQDEKMTLQGADLAPKPYEYQGDALLGYTYKGKRAYLEISGLKKLERIIYP
jgi:hypothetical protein